MKKVILTLLVSFFAITLYAQNSYLEIVRSTIKTEKKALIAEVMQLSDAESIPFWDVYNEYDQRTDNKIVREVANGLQLHDLNKKSIYSQGMIEVYRNYCTKNKCLECKIGEQIFN